MISRNVRFRDKVQGIDIACDDWPVSSSEVDTAKSGRQDFSGKGEVVLEPLAAM